ncbi:DUF2493 domain-containing protein [Hymenobacter armeniacus]|uniref:DUF2493 domain-containing protein n=1 Tax=Hymenobacter armeniacus TaxID=2771358 RepID=A0ABR8JUL8_9BACT|nr:DUF2493 domain-containing protein [Hymenobacter armeniacus]MBD2722207.1 DUF2493 domain-containing protein [Hymenobacter armeniacus]
MRVAVIGSRSFANYEQLARELDALALAEGQPITLIVSGGATGADTLAERYARERSIPTRVFLPDFKTFGRKATLVRNKDVVSAADVVWAVWDGVSKGTAHALRESRRLGIRTIVVVPELP